MDTETLDAAAAQLVAARARISELESKIANDGFDETQFAKLVTRMRTKLKEARDQLATKKLAKELRAEIDEIVAFSRSIVP